MSADGQSLRSTAVLLRARAATNTKMLAAELAKPHSKTSDLIALHEQVGDLIRAVRATESEVGAELAKG